MSRVLISQYLNELSKLRQVSGTHRESIVRGRAYIIVSKPRDICVPAIACASCSVSQRLTASAA